MVKSKRKKKLTLQQLRLRAKNIKLVLTDVDGVLTDTGIYYSAKGEELYRFSRRDGMGVDILRAAGIATAIITSEQSMIVQRRSEKLQIKNVFLGIKDKAGFLPEITSITKLQPSEMAYIGDDVNDLGIMREIAEVGLTGAPKDAIAMIAKSSHFHSNVDGGQGAFRDFAEWILGLRQTKPTRGGRI